MTRRAFTLIELISVIVIMGAISTVIAPLVTAAATTHAQSAEQRKTAESLGAALERIVRILRETPATEPGEPTPDFVSVGASSVTLTDGHRIDLIGSTLWLTAPGKTPSPLCQNVTSFHLTYLAADGVADTSMSPPQTQRIEITLASDAMELRTCVFLRIARAGP
jgi:prepilin-type N-terminal cleavage/methylation domain-containing protein